MATYQCQTCGETFAAANDKAADDIQTEHRRENRAAHLNTMTYPPRLIEGGN